MNSFNLSKKQIEILIKLLEGPKKMTELNKIIKNYPSLQKEIMVLESMGYLRREEKFERQRVVYVVLTEKGRVVAEKLQEAERISNMSSEEFEDMRKNLHWIMDVNTFTDHITGYDIHHRKKEVFNIWLKSNGKYLILYCDLCHSNSCYHIDWALNDPIIGEEIRKIAAEKGLKLKVDES